MFRSCFLHCSVMYALMALGWSGTAYAQQEMRIEAITQVSPNLPQYTRVDKPLLRDGISKSTNGRVELVLSSWSERTVSGPQVLSMVRTGQIAIAAAPLITISGEMPLLDGLDLAAMNLDISQARKVAEAMAPAINKEMERLGIRMVAHYAYSSQVLYCKKPIRGLADVRGLKVRTIGPSNADLVRSLGALPISLPLSELHVALEIGAVDCAVTGSGSGNGLRLHEVTTHLYTLPLAWSTAGYFVNLAWWNSVDPATRRRFERTFGLIQEAQWALAAEASLDGIACNVGRGAVCHIHSLARKPMIEVAPRSEDQPLIRRALVESVLPGWVNRCGDRCGVIYNDLVSPITGIRYSKDRQ